MDGTALKDLLKRSTILYFAYGLIRRVTFECSMLYSQIAHWLTRSAHSEELPLPPPRLRFWVHGNKDVDSFIRGGENSFNDIRSILASQGKWDADNLKLLDFGCGCGRVLRHFVREKPGFSYFGTDISPTCINWCKKHLGLNGTYTVNAPNPPLTFEDETFDVVIANSIFTHLNESHQKNWLRELSRVLKFNGVAIFSVHGEQVWANNPALSVRTKKQIVDEGFLFFVNSVGIRNFAGFPAYYQTTFHSKDYIEREWSKYFSIIEFREFGIERYQSIVVLTKQQTK